MQESRSSREVSSKTTTEDMMMKGETTRLSLATTLDTGLKSKNVWVKEVLDKPSSAWIIRIMKK